MTDKKDIKDFIRQNPGKALTFVLTEQLKEFISTIQRSVKCPKAKIDIYELIIDFLKEEIEILRS